MGFITKDSYCVGTIVEVDSENDLVFVKKGKSLPNEKWSLESNTQCSVSLRDVICWNVRLTKASTIRVKEKRLLVTTVTERQEDEL